MQDQGSTGAAPGDAARKGPPDLSSGPRVSVLQAKSPVSMIIDSIGDIEAEPL